MTDSHKSHDLTNSSHNIGRVCEGGLQLGDRLAPDRLSPSRLFHTSHKTDFLLHVTDFREMCGKVVFLYFILCLFIVMYFYFINQLMTSVKRIFTVYRKHCNCVT